MALKLRMIASELLKRVQRFRLREERESSQIEKERDKKDLRETKREKRSERVEKNEEKRSRFVKRGKMQKEHSDKSCQVFLKLVGRRCPKIVGLSRIRFK